MKLSLYLGEDEIRYVLGSFRKKIEIADCGCIRLREGTLINDIVAEEETVREVLRNMKAHNGHKRTEIHLLMGGNQIITKVLPVPRMSKRRLLEIVKHELRDLILPSEEASYVYNYSVIRKKNLDNKGQTILCMAMKRRVITQYVQLFKSCGMKLKSIDITADGLNNLFYYLPSYKNKTFIVSVLDGRNLMTSLYIDGVYTYTNRMRLVEERGSAACMEEMERDIRAVIHFYRVEREECGLNFVCLCGVSEAEKNILVPAIAGKEHIRVLSPGTEDQIRVKAGIPYEMSKFMYVTGNLLDSRIRFDLIKLSKLQPGRNIGGEQRLLLGMGIPAAVVAGFFFTYANNQVKIGQMEDWMEEIRAGLESEELEEKLTALKTVEAELEHREAARLGRERMETLGKQIPQMSSEILKDVVKQGNGRMELSGQKFLDGKLSLKGRAADFQDISGYVRRLEESGYFETVDYNGFTNQNPDTNETDGFFYFQIACKLKVEQ